MIATGTLALVVGPSGVGKDTLISIARDALAGDHRFMFCRRIITRVADATSEDHDSLDRAAFVEAERAGRFFLSWHVHELGYALPMSVSEALRAERIVIANVSRAVLDVAEARARHVVVYSVTAPPEVLGDRLTKRGRESVKAAAARLKRSVGIATAHAPVIKIANAGAIDDAADVLIKHLLTLPSRQRPAERGR